MVDELSAQTDPPEEIPKSRRERSSISFPYGALDDAINVARTIAGNFGTRCALEQIAAQLDHDDVDSGAFRGKIATARVFGLVHAGKDGVSLTALGRQIVQPLTEVSAKAEAFLSVPLYKAIYETYRGGLLPPDIAIENEMKRLGVAPKQVGKARQAFQRSARQAGFFAHGHNRLVLPPTVSAPSTPEAPSAVKQDERIPGGDAGDGAWRPSDDTNLLLRGLFQVLPPPGASWPEEKRKKWLQTAGGVFDLIYRD